MPANRPHLNRDEKADMILDAAESLFLANGYDSTKISAIARNANVAVNAVYWYFPGKDELLAAVLNRRLDRAVLKVGKTGSGNFMKQIKAALAALDESAILTPAVHERTRHNETVANVHERFHALIEQGLKTQLQGIGHSPKQARLAAQAFSAMLEGLHLHDITRDTKKRDDIIRWFITLLTTSAA